MWQKVHKWQNIVRSLYGESARLHQSMSVVHLASPRTRNHRSEVNFQEENSPPLQKIHRRGTQIGEDWREEKNLRASQRQESKEVVSNLRG